MLIPMTMIFQSCLGSVAAFYILQSGANLIQMIELGISVMCCMLYNATVLGQLKLTFIYAMLWISVILNTLLIIVNIWG